MQSCAHLNAELFYLNILSTLLLYASQGNLSVSATFYSPRFLWECTVAPKFASARIHGGILKNKFTKASETYKMTYWAG